MAIVTPIVSPSEGRSMQEKLDGLLHFKLKPIGIAYTDVKPEGAKEFPNESGMSINQMMEAVAKAKAAGGKPQGMGGGGKAGEGFPKMRRMCAADMMMAAKGKVVATNREQMMCPGGGVGLSFGDTFLPHIDFMLSHGNDSPGGENFTFPPHMQGGERFYDSPETTRKWRAGLPYEDDPHEWRIFAPLYDWPLEEPPDLVMLYVNPDQLAAVVNMAGYRTGRTLNVIAPNGSACQNLLYAREQARSDEPKIVIGGFDSAQRHKFPREILTMTMGWDQYLQVCDGAEEGVVSTPSWQKVDERMEY